MDCVNAFRKIGFHGICTCQSLSTGHVHHPTMFNLLPVSSFSTECRRINLDPSIKHSNCDVWLDEERIGHVMLGTS